MTAERECAIGHVTRAIATEDVKTHALAWDEFRANAGEAFDVTYDQTEHFLVSSGEATITFSDGVVLDIAPGDFVTISPDVVGKWAVTEPLYVRYTYPQAA